MECRSLPVAQVVAQLLGMQKVVGSNPTWAVIFSFSFFRPLPLPTLSNVISLKNPSTHTVSKRTFLIKVLKQV